jgi:ATP-binding cassette subfamily F protein 3
MLRSYPDLKDQEARQHLGSFGVSGQLALQPLYTLSGGQKSRVAFAKVGARRQQLRQGAAAAHLLTLRP